MCQSCPNPPPRARALGLLLVWTLAFAAVSVAQPARFGVPPEIALDDLLVTSWTTEDGLLSNTLSDVLYSHDGFIWIATFRGLLRFDGLDFTVFDQSNIPLLAADGFQADLTSNAVYRLREDRVVGTPLSGDLLIATVGSGVLSYRAGRFRSLNRKDELQVTVRCVIRDSDGRLWVGTGDFGVYRDSGSRGRQDGRFVAVDHPGLADVTVDDIHQSADGAIWFATEGKGITRLRDGAYLTFTSADGLISDAVTELDETPVGKLWIGTQEGVSFLSGGRFGTLPELTGRQVSRLRSDDHGNLWIGADQGLFRVNGRSGRVEEILEHRGKPLRSINGITFDHEGSVWLSTYGDGLYQLRRGKLDNYTVADGLASERVNAVYEQDPNNFLIGTDNGTVNVIRDGQVSTLGLRQPLPNARVRHFLEDSRGNLWISTYGGLVQVADDYEKLYTAGNGLPTNQIRFTYEDRSGHLWVGTRNAGLIRFSGGRPVEIIDKSSGLRSSFILSLEEAAAGDFFVGTHEGLAILRAGGEISHYSVHNGLPGNIVFNTLIDRQGTVWICTNGGLSRLTGDELRSLTIDHGLPTEAIFDLRLDDRGSVWLTSSIGILNIDSRQLGDFFGGLRDRVEVKIFDDLDGMADRECTAATAMLRADDGRLWVPTLGGVSVLDPDNIPINTAEPPVVIRELLVDHLSVNLDGGGETGSGEIIEIGAGAKEVVFEFSALSFQVPSKVEVKYRLTGFDEDLVAAGEQRRVRYTNLSHGAYDFHIVAANNDGVWNSRGTRVSFRIRPFFYRTPAFYVVSTLLVALFVHGVVRWRIGRVREHNVYLERIIAKQKQAEEERNQLIDELESKNQEMERFTYTVSHDLKSPLFTVQGFLGFLEKDLAAGRQERVKKDVSRMRAGLTSMAQLLEELLELSRIGRVVNPPEEVSSTELIAEAAGRVPGLATEPAIRLEVDPTLPALIGDRARLLEVFQNLLGNAVKFMGEQPDPRILATWRRDGDETVFIIRDNGIGIEPAYHEKVFGLFDRLARDLDGTGIGLAIVKRIVEVHDGRVWVESEGRGTGSTFCFTLPQPPRPA